MHQLAEYVIGLALVGYGLQSPTPLVPCLAGLLVAGHAAFTIGPLAAFRVIRPALHRWIDLGVIAVVLLAAVQPWAEGEVAGRVVLALAAGALVMMWLGSRFETRAERKAAAKVSEQTAAAPATPGRPPDRATAIGQRAGRLVGRGVRAWRSRRPSDPV